MAWIRKRNGRVEMRAFPLYSQKVMFKDLVFEFDCRFRKFDTCPLSDVLDKAIWRLGSHLDPEIAKLGGLGGEI